MNNYNISNATLVGGTYPIYTAGVNGADSPLSFSYYPSTNYGNISGAINSVTANSFVASGNITAANISLTGNTGFPSNTSTVQAWARVTIGTTAYWTPLYQ